MSGFEWTNDHFLQLGTKGLMPNPRIGLQDLDQLLSKQGVSICKLERKCWKDSLNIAPVLEISRTKETRAKFPICERDLGKRLGNGRLPGPREAIEPEYALGLLVLQPMFELQEDFHSRSSQAPISVPRTIAGLNSAMHILQNTAVLISLFTGYYKLLGSKGAKLTMDWQLLS